MDSYLKQLLGNSACPSVHIVDDNVSSASDCGGRELISHNHFQRRNKSIATSGRRNNHQRSSSMMTERKRCGRCGVGSHCCLRSGTMRSTPSATDHLRQRWGSMTCEEVATVEAATRATRRYSDSAAGKPRRKCSFDDSFEKEDVHEGQQRESSSSSMLDCSWNVESCSVFPFNRLLSLPPRLSQSMDVIKKCPGESRLETGRTLPDVKCNDLQSTVSQMTQDPLQGDCDEAFGKSYMVALKPDASTEELGRRSMMLNPPEKPERRTSDDSMTLIAVLEAAMAASPLSSSSTILGPEEAERTYLQGCDMLHLSPHSLAATSPLDHPVTVKGLSYETLNGRM